MAARLESSGDEILQRVRRAVEQYSRFALFSHEEPDGDAIGSQVALSLALRSLGKDVVSVRLQEIPEALRFLNRDLAVERYNPGRDGKRLRDAEVAFILDSSRYQRLGELAPVAESLRSLKINIDHHRDNLFFGDINFVRFGAGGTAELVWEVVAALGVPIKGTIAEGIYVGICTDTLGFKYIDPAGNIVGIIAELVRGGIDFEDLQERLYYHRPESYLEDISSILGSVSYDNGGSLAWFLMPGREPLTYYQRDLATEALHQLLSIERVRASMMFHDCGTGIEVWLRSKTDVDVGMAAERLGGGGHKTASGVLLGDTALEEAVSRVLAQVRASTGS